MGPALYSHRTTYFALNDITVFLSEYPKHLPSFFPLNNKLQMYCKIALSL